MSVSRCSTVSRTSRSWRRPISPCTRRRKRAGTGSPSIGRRRTAQPRVSSRLAEAERIQRALTHDQLELHCQPILDLATNVVSQYELLLRLRTDHGSLLPPSAFLYVAERFGTIVAIDSWVVRQAVALIAMEAKAGRSLTLNVNISAKSIGNPQLVTVIDRALADARIDPACLVFELTETAAIGNIDHAKTFTTELRSRGCRFALDDFGSGFGSFYYLKHLPFDYFKIDGDFIRGFGANTTDQLVVEAIVGIAKGMGKKTVAEFVTDQGMTDRLRRSGIDYAQGFHIGVPQPIDETFPEACAQLTGGLNGAQESRARVWLRVLASVAQHHAQEGVVDLQAAVVVDEPELAKLVHEEVDPRARGADHLRQDFLRHFRQGPVRRLEVHRNARAAEGCVPAASRWS